jgi:hypothetical protein
MHRFSIVLIVVAPLCCSSIASAQEAAPRSDAPPARVGFQTAIRTGYTIPMGKVSGLPADDMTDSFSGQIPLFFEMGGKPHPNFFIGGYLGLGFGRAAGPLQRACDSSNITCTGIAVRLGVEFQYHILPAALANPWIGYGIGYESMRISMSRSGQSVDVTVTGVEFARFMGGVDFRVDPNFGIGPFADVSLGQFSNVRSDPGGGASMDREIPNKAMHEWLTVGVRGVFFP